MHVAAVKVLVCTANDLAPVNALSCIVSLCVYAARGFRPWGDSRFSLVVVVVSLLVGLVVVVVVLVVVALGNRQCRDARALSGKSSGRRIFAR